MQTQPGPDDRRRKRRLANFKRRLEKVLIEIRHDVKAVRDQVNRHGKLLGEDDPEKSIFLLCTLLDSRIHILEKKEEEARADRFKVNLALVVAVMGLFTSIIGGLLLYKLTH